MKILFLTHYFPPEGNAPATRVGALTKKWVAEGHEVTVVTGAPNVPDGVVYPGYKNAIASEELTDDGVRLLRVWSWIAPNKGTVRRIGNFVSFMVSSFLRCVFLEKPDVVIATSPQFFCGWAGVLLKYWYKLSRPFSKTTPFVLEIRDIWPESIQAVGAMQGGPVIRLLEKMELWLYAAADHIVTVGKGYQGRLEEKGVSPERISIIMNGVDREVLEAQHDEREVNELKQSLGIADKFVCSYIGTIGMASGLDVYHRAAKILQERGRDDIALVAVGDGAVREELEQQASTLGLKNILFTGRRPKQEMPLFLAASDVSFVHLKKTPLFATVIPSKIFEAMGMRRPILIGVDGEAKSLVEQGQAGIAIEPEDAVAMVDALIELADAPELRQQFGQQGRQFVEQHFDREALALEYLEILRRV